MNANTAKVASIVPLAHLNLIKHDRYFMALSYACASMDYIAFFKARREEGKYVILDNSVVEMGRPENIYSYLMKAIAMDASEILTPDYLHDRIRTVDELRSGINVASQMGYTGGIMAVPQGRDIREYLLCVAEMLEYPINTLGISRRYTDMFGGTRRRIVEQVGDRMMIEGRRDVKVHLLGCWDHPVHDIGDSLKLPFVRGIDGSLPSLFAGMNILLEENVDRPDDAAPIDILNDKYDENILEHNLLVWRRLVHQSTL